MPLPCSRTSAIAPATLIILLLLGGCASSKETPAPPPPPPPRATPSALPTATRTVTPTATPSPVDPSATPPMRETKQVQVLDIQSSGHGDRLEVSGRIVDDTGQPIVGAVGDFYVEGAGRNLVTGYATKEDGSFRASFTAAEVPPEATLMLHFRGDDQHSSGSFLIRRGTPKPATTQPQAPTTRPAPARLTGPDGQGTPKSTLTGTELVVTGRALDPSGGPLGNTRVQLQVGTQRFEATSGADGGFRLTGQPGPAREGQLTVDNGPATRITW